MHILIMNAYLQIEVTCIIIILYRGDNVDEGQQPTLVHQLKLELSQKNKIFSKTSIHLSKIVGQGVYNPQTCKRRSSIFLVIVCLGDQRVP